MVELLTIQAAVLIAINQSSSLADSCEPEGLLDNRLETSQTQPARNELLNQPSSWAPLLDWGKQLDKQLRAS